METIFYEAIAFIGENLIEIIVGFGTILAVIKTRGRSLDEIKKLKEKKLEKLKAKNNALRDKLTNGLREEVELQEQIQNVKS